MSPVRRSATPSSGKRGQPPKPRTTATPQARARKVVTAKKPARPAAPPAAPLAKGDRCFWAATDPLLGSYHDEEWGVPVHDDRHWFEKLILDGAQAGLSWLTILRKRDAYREAYLNFDPQKVARFDARDEARLMANAGIVRNAAKIRSSVRNALAFLQVQAEHGSFDAYIWKFVEGQPLQPRPGHRGAVPARTELSDRISVDLKKRGFSFVGSTIIYAFMQAAGLVNDHTTDCFRHAHVARLK